MLVSSAFGVISYWANIARLDMKISLSLPLEAGESAKMVYCVPTVGFALVTSKSRVFLLSPKVLFAKSNRSHSLEKW